MSKKSIHAAAGEYLVLGELLRRGRMAFLAQGPTQIGWDIIIVPDSEQCDHNKKIQIKTIDWPCRNAVQINLNNNFDFLVVVLLNREDRMSRFLICTKEDIEPHLSPENSCRGDKNRTLNITKDRLTALCTYEDNWDLL